MNPRPGPTARSVALEAIRRVVDEGAYSNLVVPALLGRSGLDGRDRAFAAELAYGTLRRLIPLDHAIEARSSRPIARMTPGARNAIRLGAYQIAYTSVPAHAAVGETVGLVGPRERAFVNAVLRRVGLIRRQARRLDLSPLLVVHDATQPALAHGFDRVLVDAPCSGIGSARRRPELLWRVDEKRLTTLAGRQLRLVEAAADLVRPGGRLVYSVCTFPRAETEAVCDALLRSRGDLRPLATAGPNGTSERHRLWPHRDGSDGMFVAAFSRSSAIAAG